MLGVAGIPQQTQHLNCSCRLGEENGEKNVTN